MKKRVNIIVRGAVQGVGFRPFVYKLARELNLKGYVLNNSTGVVIQAEGEFHNISNFLLRIEKEKPSLSIITSFEHSFLDPIGFKDFSIKKSKRDAETNTLILPDISVCKDCLREMWNPKDRRFRYPFINCTNCGPRFSIIETLPYDRPNTSMKNFTMCEDCKAEYENPKDRRFHAQPIACPNCGPQIFLLSKNGKVLFIKEEALLHAARNIQEGKIAAIKGIGGFQLVCDASNDAAVSKLRKRKKRNEKPFAVMIDSIGSIQSFCKVSKYERRILLSPESPIVLLKRKRDSKKITDAVAPNNPYLGITLPYSPLHHLLMKELKTPIVATSGNLSEEPICIDNEEALERLNGIADYFLVHNRPIIRHADDSIVRVVLNREMVLRRARGYAPLPLFVSENQNEKNILAVGAHLKNTIAIKKRNQIFISQHIGDLSSSESMKAFDNTVKDFINLYDFKPELALKDLHPDYYSSRYIEKSFPNLISVQHHKAHIAACRLENQIEGNALGVAWDGTGYGDDGKVWGGEFFVSTNSSFSHIAQFRNFKLPGSEKAIEEPRRSLAGIFYEMGLIENDLVKAMFKSTELNTIKVMLAENFNSLQTSSAGRLFDAVSALLGICYISEFEGHAAMLLEFAADKNEKKHYDFYFMESGKLIINWQPIFEGIIKDKKNKVGVSKISAKFHNTLAKIIGEISERFGLEKIILSGGCFQNVYLLEKTIRLLERKNKKVYWHQRIPANDGGISFGQIAYYLIQQKNN